MTKGDKALILIIIIISFASLAFINKSTTGYNEKYVSIQVNGKEVKRVIFDKSIVGKTIAIQTEYGYNLIEIGDERVRVIEADCLDKLDVKQGYISQPNQLIVCLPNRLVIEIKGLEQTDSIDYISH